MRGGESGGRKRKERRLQRSLDREIEFKTKELTAACCFITPAMYIAALIEREHVGLPCLSR